MSLLPLPLCLPLMTILPLLLLLFLLLFLLSACELVAWDVYASRPARPPAAHPVPRRPLRLPPPS